MLDHISAGARAVARDDGAPGLRPHDHPIHRIAAGIDPDGSRIKAVCRAPA